MIGRAWLRGASAAVAILAAAGTAVACSSPTPTISPGSFTTAPPPPVQPTAVPTYWPAPSPVSRPSPPGMASVGEYLHAVQLAVRDHLQVWIETELTTRWLNGAASFRAGIQRAAFLANRPGVVGIKIADELGYQDGLTTPGQIRRFLLDTARALHAAAPHKLILVDMVLPQLGCMPGHKPAGFAATACMAQAQKAYPQLALPEVGSYLRLHAINVLDVSTGLLTSSQYASWGTSINAAQLAAWQEMKRLGWNTLATLQARKALAHPGKFPGGTRAAEADMRTYVDIPLSAGADAVDIWTWHQKYEGGMYRLLNPGLKTNALWTALAQQHRDHHVLYTHMSPTSVEGGLATDLAMIAGVFNDVFLPAGTG